MMDWWLERIQAFEFTKWEALLLFGEMLFFARQVAIWAASEESGKPVLNAMYWYMSFAGAAVVAICAIEKESLGLLIPQVIGAVIYTRGWVMERTYQKREHLFKRIRFDQPQFKWPHICVILDIDKPIKEETLESIRGSQYPSSFIEITALHKENDISEKNDALYSLLNQYNVKIVPADAKMNPIENRVCVFMPSMSKIEPDTFRRIVEILLQHQHALAVIPSRLIYAPLWKRIRWVWRTWLAKRVDRNPPGAILAAWESELKKQADIYSMKRVWTRSVMAMVEEK